MIVFCSSDAYRILKSSKFISYNEKYEHFENPYIKVYELTKSWYMDYGEGMHVWKYWEDAFGQSKEGNIVIVPPLTPYEMVTVDYAEGEKEMVETPNDELLDWCGKYNRSKQKVRVLLLSPRLHDEIEQRTKKEYEAASKKRGLALTYNPKPYNNEENAYLLAMLQRYGHLPMDGVPYGSESPWEKILIDSETYTLKDAIRDFELC